jgi:hypothetical protein
MKNDDVPVRVELQNPGNIKDLGGGEVEAWNDRIMRMVLSAMPINHRDKVEAGKVGTAVFSGMLDLKAADPIEGMLIAQLVIAHEGAMSMYQRAWQQPPEHFDAKTRYLALADKAQRTVIMLTERLDHHRGRGQQQITVKHVTVNADQAIVGNVEHHRGAGSPAKSEDQPHAIAYAPQPAVRSQDQERQLVPVGSNEERSVPDARRDLTGRSKGK